MKNLMRNYQRISWTSSVRWIDVIRHPELPWVTTYHRAEQYSIHKSMAPVVISNKNKISFLWMDIASALMNRKQKQRMVCEGEWNRSKLRVIWTELMTSFLRYNERTMNDFEFCRENATVLMPMPPSHKSLAYTSVWYKNSTRNLRHCVYVSWQLNHIYFIN